VIEEYEGAGKGPTTFKIAAEVYRVRPDRRGNRMVSDAQHVATKRALASLRQKGLVSGRQDITVCPDGRNCSRTAEGWPMDHGAVEPSGAASGRWFVATLSRQTGCENVRQIERHPHNQARGRAWLRQP